MSVDECEEEVEFLLDCGSSVSIIKAEALEDDARVHVLKNPIGIEGIGNGIIYTKNYIELTLDSNIHHVFLVVQDNFKIDQMGIIGSDFCHEQGAVINYQNHTLNVDKATFEIQTVLTSLGNVKIPVRIAKSFKKMTKANNRIESDESARTVDDSEESSGDCSNTSQGQEPSCSDESERSDTESDELDEKSSSSRSSQSNTESDCENESAGARGSGRPSQASSLSDVSSLPTDTESEEPDETSAPKKGRKNLNSRQRAKRRYKHVTVDLSDKSGDPESESSKISFSSNCDSETEVTVPKQSMVYAKVRVNRIGVGQVPEIVFSDEVFSASAVVDSKDEFVRIPIFNTSDENVNLKIPNLKLQDWFEEKEVAKHKALVKKLSTTETSTRFKEICKILNLKHLNEEEKDALLPLIREFSDIFQLKGDKFEPNQAFEHKIELQGDPKPLKLKQHRIPFALKPEMEKNVKDLLEKDIIEESTSPWNMPVFLVDKRSPKDGAKRYRMVVDMRRLNELIIQDAYPLPVIDEMLGKLGQSKYFSILDLFSGFYQIGLDEESRKYCSFSVLDKKYQLKRLAMGLKNAPATFQKMMTKVLEGALDKNAMLYIHPSI